MKVPFIKYIEALVASKKSYEEIFMIVKNLDVTMSTLFTEDDILQVVNHVVGTNPEYFKSTDLVPDLPWLKKLDIEKMVAYILNLQIPEGTIGISGAMEIIKDKNMYQTMSALALSTVTEEDIELIVNAKYNIHYGPDDIREFLHYFFNVENWNLSDKKDYVALVSDHKLKKHYEMALAGDKDYLIWKLGIAPDRSFDGMLREMGTDCFYHFKEKTKAYPDEAQRWGNLALRIVDRLEKLNQDTNEKKTLFDEIEFTLKGKLVPNSKEERMKKDPLETFKKEVDEEDAPVKTEFGHIKHLQQKGEIANEEII